MTIKHACREKRRGYIYLPSIGDCGIVWISDMPLMELKVRKKNTFYICREGCIYVAGNSWMYEVRSGKGDPVLGYGLLNLTYTHDRVWYTCYDNKPLLFVKISRLKLLFS